MYDGIYSYHNIHIIPVIPIIPIIHIIPQTCMLHIPGCTFSVLSVSPKHSHTHTPFHTPMWNMCMASSNFLPTATPATITSTTSTMITITIIISNHDHSLYPYYVAPPAPACSVSEKNRYHTLVLLSPHFDLLSRSSARSSRSPRSLTGDGPLPSSNVVAPPATEELQQRLPLVDPTAVIGLPQSIPYAARFSIFLFFSSFSAECGRCCFQFSSAISPEGENSVFSIGTSAWGLPCGKFTLG